jgi:hypothetical protein
MFADGNNFKNFNELWIRKHSKKVNSHPIEADDFSDGQRHYYLWILLIAILIFIAIIHKLSQYLLRVTTIPKTYTQVAALPNYL